MKNETATSGLSLNEPLLWERGRKGRCGVDLPGDDVPQSPLPEEVRASGPPDIPDLAEIDVVRHYTRLSTWNFGVDTGMYPLGSCTMKYNPKTNERQAGLAGFCNAHPLLPENLSQGALRLMAKLQTDLCEITGMDAASLQPAAGAHGELAGMLILHAYFAGKGKQRHKIIIPDTAHGTNPASAALCGFRPVAVPSGPDGILLAETVRDVMDEDTAGIMLTNPNTLGLFEAHIPEISRIVHEKGGLVYADGANLNALMGIVRMGCIGVDVMHLNLHKTFSTPHGGGGPGAGPVLVKKFLDPFLPVPRVIRNDDGSLALSEDFPFSIGRLVGFFGHFLVWVRAYSYIRSLGPEGLKRASQLAVLNANYIRARLKDTYHLPYETPCLHECVFSDKDLTPYKVSTLDVAKRLMDHGFHPPTIYFPLVVHGSLMIEPTETESKEEIDRFVDAMINIAAEAKSNPDLLHAAPCRTRVTRLDEVEAARRPCLVG
ncbi:aminomethyl-transferring glycine dehydrogenase subunit GcvPB [Desulfatirhabdium butyrativorans]|uniref:aminomethyl-transferring glycine dehydrogenase subunit GcvPB n=1 Tax=Desulfatirhabdium butyrativorans TaxID=340467 RepID=UPI000405BF4D|nr:aminomethyl-transferring glycine dehydrogenase subunit GcvPB [Desulfatirhabdium butyrativorans]